MNAYKITGTSRQVGAIGISEPFERIITANTPREAYNQNREYLYAKGREHVLTTSMEESRVATVCGLGAIGTAFMTVDPDLYA
jgi:hypothetical protein